MSRFIDGTMPLGLNGDGYWTSPANPYYPQCNGPVPSLPQVQPVNWQPFLDYAKDKPELNDWLEVTQDNGFQLYSLIFDGKKTYTITVKHWETDQEVEYNFQEYSQINFK